ncbi:copper homeostasis protein CutC [Bacillus kwashiorkori]|uniref:copper homeostasis protein CutC n=1 Tax=Bacillus kwashiorkori TaxID=1522318 RepID=UPI000782DACE|nr:copper homeostasis protein CutC [Bacillus kwashiorkori]
MLLEVIATNVEDAIFAEKGGADRLELCSALTEGGLTPSLGLVEAVTDAVKIPVNVMVRPHSRSFCYSDDDIKVMVKDIEYIRKTKENGIVIGPLTSTGLIDEENLKRLIHAAAGMDITFHRAFDEVSNQLDALGTLMKYRDVKRILTAGGQKPAPESASQLKKLVNFAEASSVKILAGYGITKESLASFIPETGVEEIHIGSAVRFNNSFQEQLDWLKVREIKDEMVKHSIVSN